MSELIEASRRKKELMKHLMLQIHQGTAPEAVRKQLARIMGEVPYDRVVEVEQELLAEGLPSQEILKFCDIHTEVLKGTITHEGSKKAPCGHPVDTFGKENQALQWEVSSLRKIFEEIRECRGEVDVSEAADLVKIRFNALADVDKHYSRKENLLFPFLEKHGIIGPSKVMWAKDDQVRELLEASLDALKELQEPTAEAMNALIDLIFERAVEAVEDMIYREEEILFPMSLDSLTEREWLSVYRQSPGIGFCLFDPEDDWQPETLSDTDEGAQDSGAVELPSGFLEPAELNAILNSIPFDLTFVDKEDRVRYFTQGRERIFTRTRAIIGRKVQLCHPPASVHIVEQILEDFKSGKQSRAPFWLNLKGRFIHIEYFALRDGDGKYLGTLEVSQDLTEKRQLTGEQRLLEYAEESNHVQ